jgi:hypothetical protein
MTQRQIELDFDFAPFFLKFVRIFDQVFLKFALLFDSEKAKGFAEFFKCLIILALYQEDAALDLMQISDLKNFAFFLLEIVFDGF